MTEPQHINPSQAGRSLRTIQQSTQLRNPALDLLTDAGQKIYHAFIERRLILLERRDIMLRAALEAATGRPYDSFDPAEMSVSDIQEVIAQDMARGLNLSIEDARDRVAQNWIQANPSQMEKPTNA